MAKGEFLKTELDIVQEDSPEIELSMSNVEKPKRPRKARKKKESNELVNELDEASASDEQPKRNVVRKIVDLVKDERTHKIFGLALVLFSVYTAVAIGSYFFTWKVDQDIVK